MKEKNFTLKISSDTGVFSIEDKVSKIRFTFKNNSNSKIELNYLFIYILEGESHCWELFRRKDQKNTPSLSRIFSEEIIVVKPREEKILLEETLYDLLEGGKDWYWNWMCRHHPKSQWPTLKGNNKVYVEEVNFKARLTKIMIGKEETWCNSNKLKISIHSKSQSK